MVAGNFKFYYEEGLNKWEYRTIMESYYLGVMNVNASDH